MTSLIRLFNTQSEEAPDNDKLVDLFRNRAELKKEFAALRTEKYQLQDRIKQQEGATARVQQKMDHLENLLLDREWVHNVIAFYQLRWLAAHCNAKLMRFAEELKHQREQRIQNKAMNDWNAQRAEKVADIDRLTNERRLKTQLLEDQLQSVRHTFSTMSGLAKMFRGRIVEKEVDGIVKQIELSQAEEAELLRALENIRNLPAPDYQGLDDATKRSINFMILAFVQQLYLHYEDDNLAAMAKEASEKSVGAINYGTKYECDEILERIEKRRDTMESATDFADILQTRSKLIADHAKFRSDTDVVPVSSTVATVYAIDANGLVKEKDANLLGDNYFGVVKALSR